VSTNDRYQRAERFLPWNVRDDINGVFGASWLDSERIALQRDGREVAVDLSSGIETRLIRGKTPPRGVVASPDGAYELRRVDGNLELLTLSSGVTRLLTQDGVPGNNYAGSIESNARTVTERRLDLTPPLYAMWSPDSRYVHTHRLDERDVAVSYIVEHVRPGARRPILHPYRENDWLRGKPVLESMVIEVSSGNRQTIQHGHVPILIEPPLGYYEAWWSPDSSITCLLVRDEGWQSIRLLAHDVTTKTTRTVLTDQIDGTIRTNADFGLPGTRILWDRGEVVMWSERDGHGHLWLHDLASGEVVRQLTKGEWVVRDIVYVDEATGHLWFLGAGRHPSANPYHRQLYLTTLDGSSLECLTDDSHDHSVVVSPDGTRFLDAFGAIDRFPTTVVRALDGTVSQELGQASAPGLAATGWHPPLPLHVTLDGTTLHGALYHPTDFDPSSNYPLLDDVYCANDSRVPSRVPDDGDPWNEMSYWFPQAVAELGFCVLVLDGRGGPHRSLAFREHGWVNTIDDHADAIRTLGAELPYLDLDRVGIYGHSAGGFIATQGLVDHGDLFTAGVASAASFALDLTPWADNTMTRKAGMGEEGRYDVTQRLGDLRGELLVVMGEVDEIVPPAHLMRFFDALITANKDADIVVLPNANHSFRAHPYFIRRLWGHFVKHILGETPPDGYQVGTDPNFLTRMLITDGRSRKLDQESPAGQ